MIPSTMTIIHACIELIAIGSVIYWTYSKTSKLQEQVDALTERLNKYEEFIKSQGEIIAQHENALRQMHTMIQSFTGNNIQPTSIFKNPSKPNPRTGLNKRFEKKNPTPEPEFEEDVDDLLSEELSELNQPNPQNEDCGEDGCLIVRNRKKKQR